MRTCVRVDPACRPRLLLRVGRAAGRSAPQGEAGHRRRRRRARRELRGEGAGRPHRHGRAARAAPLPRRGRRPAPIPGLRRCEQGRVPGVRRPVPRGRGDLDRRSVPRRAAASSGSGERPARSPSAFGAPSSRRSVCRSRSAWRARSSSQRWRAASRSRTACSSFPRTGSSSSSTRSRSSGSGASDQVTAEKLRRRGITTVGQVAGIPEAALVWMLGRASGRQLHALAHNRDPRPVVQRRRRRSIGSQCALGRGERPTEEIDAIVVALVDGVARRLRRARRVGRTVVLRLRFDDFTRATRSRTLRRPTAHTGTILAAMRELARPTPAR